MHHHFREDMVYDGQIEGLGHSCDLQPLGNSADAPRVNNQNRDGARLQHVPERNDAPQIFAGGGGRGQSRRDAGKAVKIIVGREVLQPEEAQFVEPPADFDRLLERASPDSRPPSA